MEENCSFEKETIISIPFSKEEKLEIKEFYLKNVANPEWDYSFWGERCASNCFRLLLKYNKVSKGSRFLKAFFPAQLIYTLKREAKKKGTKSQQKMAIQEEFGLKAYSMNFSIIPVVPFTRMWSPVLIIRVAS